MDRMDQPLNVAEDERLAVAEKGRSGAGTEIKRPPGILTLREWGKLILPSGKHAGKTYLEGYQDKGYVHQLRNRNAVSTWVVSFQMFCMAMEEKRIQEVRDQQAAMDAQVKNQEKVKSYPKPSQGPVAKTKKPPTTTDHGWEKVEMTSGTSGKRGATDSSTTESDQEKKMSMEPNPHRVQQLNEQIAMLQRELARETQSEDQ